MSYYAQESNLIRGSEELIGYWIHLPFWKFIVNLNVLETETKLEET